MREYAAPTTVRGPDDREPHRRRGRATPASIGDAVVFSRKRGDGLGGRHRRASSSAEVAAVAKGLIAAGVEAGDRVALISRTRYEWTLLDYAIWFAGAVTVPVYETSSADQVGWILRDSGAARRGRRDARPPGPGRRRSAAGLAELQPRLVDRRTTRSTC